MKEDVYPLFILCMTPNTWYYTLSALSQVLGGVLGLNAIFVAVKLEHIIKQIDYYKRRGASIIKWENKKEADKRISFDGHFILKHLQTIWKKHHDDPAFIVHLEKTLNRYDPSLRATSERALRFTEDTIYSLEDNLKQRNKVIYGILLPSFITMVAIFASLFMLAFTDYFLKEFPANMEALVGVVIIGIFGMCLIAHSSYRILWSIE